MSILYYLRILCLKTDFYSKGMGTMIFKAVDNEDAMQDDENNNLG